MYCSILSALIEEEFFGLHIPWKRSWELRHCWVTLLWIILDTLNYLFNNVKTWCISFILQTQCSMFAGFLSVTGGGVVGSLRISDFCIANSFTVLHFSSDMLWFVFSLISDKNSYTMVEYFNFIIRFLHFWSCVLNFMWKKVLSLITLVTAMQQRGQENAKQFEFKSAVVLVVILDHGERYYFHYCSTFMKTASDI